MNEHYEKVILLVQTQEKIIKSISAEVIRLREENERLRDMIEKAVGYGAYDEEYWGEEE